MLFNRMRGVLAATVVLGGIELASAPARDTSTVEPLLISSVAAETLPRFDRVLFLESTSETSANVNAGDVNADGHLDLVLAKGRHWPLVDRVLLGDGAGHFRTACDLGPTADRSYSGRLVDVDRDGDLDVVISNAAPDPKLVYINDGKGHFRVGSTYGRAEWETRNATVVDLDGDGYPDIVVANRGDSASANYICFNKGNSAGTPVGDRAVTPYALAMADVNGDGKVDIVVGNVKARSTVYFNEGNGQRFHAIHFGDNEGTVYGFAIADLDRDGVMDIAAARSEARNVVYFGSRPTVPRRGSR